MTLTAIIVLWNRDNISNVKNMINSLCTHNLIYPILEKIIIVNNWESELNCDFNNTLVEILEMGKNYGPMTGRLLALQKCTTTHVWFLDDDDKVLQVSPLIKVNWEDDIDIYRFSRIGQLRHQVDYGCDEFIQSSSSSIVNTPLWNKFFRTKAVLEAMSEYIKNDLYNFFYYAEDIFLTRMVFRYLGKNIKVEDLAGLILYSSNASTFKCNTLEECKERIDKLFTVNQKAKELYVKYDLDTDAVKGGLLYFIQKVYLPNDCNFMNELKDYLRPLLRESSDLYENASDSQLNYLIDSTFRRDTVYTIPLFKYSSVSSHNIVPCQFISTHD